MIAPEHAQAVLQLQLGMTRETWQRLQSHGVDEGSSLSLDFYFKSPSYAQAGALKGFLTEETDYDVKISALEDEWLVHGSTLPTTVTLPILEQWVEWMVLAGFRFDSEFDGWGAEV